MNFLNRSMEMKIYQTIKELLSVNDSFVFSRRDLFQCGWGAWLSCESRAGRVYISCRNSTVISMLYDQCGISQKEKIPGKLHTLVIYENNPFEVLEWVARRMSLNHPDAPRWTGYVGSDAYEFLPNAPKYRLERVVHAPEMLFVIPEIEVTFDRITEAITVKSLSSQFSRERIMAAILDCMNSGDCADRTVPEEPTNPGAIGWAEISRGVNFIPNDEKYISIVQRAKRAIEVEPSLFKIVVSRYGTGVFCGIPAQLFQEMRVHSPAPYEFLFETPTFQAVGCSPEMLVEIEGDKITLRVLAGTSMGDQEGNPDAIDLLEDPKEVVEHLYTFIGTVGMMNQNCLSGSVRVKRVLDIVEHGCIRHFSSEVQGMSRNHRVTRWKDFLPTLTGTPGLAAFRKVVELEPMRRGIFGGIFGSFNGRYALFCKVIRSSYLEDGRFFVFAGAGITPYSKPENELVETQNKMRGCLYALMKANEQKER